MNPIWFLRMKRWAQRPPSWWKVKLVIAVVCICFVLYGLEQTGLLPEWMAADRASPRGLR